MFLRFTTAILAVALLIPFLLMIALRGPELFFKKEERENIRRRFQQARQWVIGRSPDRNH